RFWIEPQMVQMPTGAADAEIFERRPVSDWFYIPSWKRSISTRATATEITTTPRSWLLFGDDCGLARQLRERLEARGEVVTVVTQADDHFTMQDTRTYALDPRRREHYEALFDSLQENGTPPTHIVHLWSLSKYDPTEKTEAPNSLDAALDR